MTTKKFGATPVYEQRRARDLLRRARRRVASVIGVAIMLCGLPSAPFARRRPALRRETPQTINHSDPPRSPQQATALAPSTPVERELAGGQSHTFQLTLAANQYLQVVVAQRGIDVLVTLFAPDGKKLSEVDSPNGTQGPEQLSFITETAGSYRLEVRSLEKDAAAGRYEVKIEELRAATEQDKRYIAAKRVSTEGDQLITQGTAQSLRKAIEKYEEALLVWRSVGNRGEEAVTLNNIGTVYMDLGELPRAREHFSQALTILRALGERREEAVALNNIAVIHNALGEGHKALDYFNEALPLLRAAGDRRGEAGMLNNMGLVHNLLGENQDALERHYQALSLRRAVSDQAGEAQSLNNIGLVYLDLGEAAQALNFFNQALPLRRAAGDRRGEAATLNNIGRIYTEAGEQRKALDFFNQALPISKLTGDRRTEAYTLNNIAGIYNALDEKQKALGYYEQALPIMRALGDRHGEATVLNSIGVAYDHLQEKQKALEYFNQSLMLSRAASDSDGEARTLYNIARFEMNRGDFAGALSQSEAALKIVEALRTKVVSQELRASYFASVRGYYEFYINLLMQMHKRQPSAGHDAKALQASERARARSLIELLNEAHADIRQGGDPALLERERAIRQKLNAKAERQTRLRRMTPPEMQAEAVTNEIEALEKEIESLTAEFQQVQSQIRVKSPRYAALTQPQPPSLEEIQQLLDAETLLLEFSLGEERSYLWTVTHTSLKSYELPGRAEIETLARRVVAPMSLRGEAPRGESEYREWKARIAEADAAYPEAASGLSRLLLGSAAAEMSGRRLLIVADGILQYVPFAALPEPGTLAMGSANQPLIAGHELVMLPSASTLTALRSNRRQRRPYARAVVAFADPVFDAGDPRVGRVVRGGKARRAITSTWGDVQLQKSPAPTTALAGNSLRSVSEARLTSRGHLDRLLYSKREAEAILAAVPAGQGTAVLDFDASRERVMRSDLAGYRIVHFATHGLLDSQHPELSGVVLSLVNAQGEPQNGFLRLNEIFNLNLPVDMVVLSACQTALGKEIRGEGLVGLTRGFMYAGAPRVVASLWSVDDMATAELMRVFYQKMLRERMSPAAALRAAQNELRLHRQEKWRAPFYWAGFVLQGEWQNVTK